MPPSLIDTPPQLFDWLANLLLKRYKLGHKSGVRVVFVLGAGASVWSGLPTWDERFKRLLIKAAGGTLRSDDVFVAECWRALTMVIGQPPRHLNPSELRELLIERASIEDIAGVALKYAVVGDSVYELLNQTFTARDAEPLSGAQPPQLAYELVAHFLKHGFVDHLVTFNFDELLDEAVSNELGRGEFASIASDHDVPVYPQVRLPHVIKLHGTLSRPQTLRFTNATTHSLPEHTVRLLDTVLLGIGDADPDSEGAARHFVSMGYGWRDPDALRWVEARQREIQRLLILSKGEDVKRLTSTFDESRGWAPGQVQILNLDDLWSEDNRDDLTVDLILWALWSELEQRMTAEKIPFMPASRHLLLGYLFGPNRGVGQPLNPANAVNRFVAEAALHVAKCKGMINLSTMAGSDRISRYYGEVRRKFSERARNRQADLICLATSLSFADGARNKENPEYTLTQATYPDVKETYFAKASTKKQLAKPFTNAGGFTLGAVHAPKFDGPSGRIRQDFLDGREFVETHMGQIFDGPEIEVGRRPVLRETWSLRSATPIYTYIDLQNKTMQCLCADWSRLLVVAESGAWLAGAAIAPLITAARPRPRPRDVLLIKARQPEQWSLRELIDVDLQQKWHEYKEAGVSVLSTELSWWQHNRHLTLAFKETDEGLFEFKGGVYFRRRHKASRIQPLFLDKEDPEDAAELVLTFLAYVRRAMAEGRTDEGDILLCERACDIARRLARPESVKDRIDEILRQLQAMQESRSKRD